MANQRRKLDLLLKETNVGTHLRLEVYYTMGGMNYFTSKVESRGLFFSVTPVTIGDRSVTTTAFSGIKKCVLEMARFAQKKFDTFKVDNETKEQLIKYVLEKHGIELAEPLKVDEVEI